MLNIISVFIGGGIGSVLRYIMNITFSKPQLCEACALPLATLSVNILGSFLLGFIYAVVSQKTGFPPAVKLALGVGFCGGLTTFSTFSLEAFDLIKNGEIIAGISYILASVIICLLMTGIGIYSGTMLGAYFGK